VDHIFLPGERELRLRAERLASGIPLRPAITYTLSELGRELGLRPPFD
jgi:LDH2 family malate/lactate/ureidoglycolate dehydrogenase